MRWLLIACLVLGCSKREEAKPVTEAKTSHPAMPNQFEVGSTINGRYLVTKKIGEVGDYNVFAVERVKDKSLTMVAPKTPAHSIQLRDAVMKEMNDKVLPWLDLDVTPDNRSYYVVGELTEAQLRDILSGAHVIGNR